MRPRREGFRPRLVALDVDGTVLGYDGSLSPAVRAAVHGVRAGGAQVVLATGRSLHAVRPVAAELGLDDGYLVCSNGAVVADMDGGPLRVVTFDASAPVRFFADQVPDALLAVEELGVGYRVTGEFPAGELRGAISVVSPEALLAGPVTRLVVRWPDGDRDRLLRLASAAGLHGVDYVIGYTAWLDVMPAGVSKASGLEDVRRRLGTPPEATLAVGDGHNDVEMLRWAAYGVAMGQAPPDVRAAADALAPPVDADGLAHVLAPWI